MNTSTPPFIVDNSEDDWRVRHYLHSLQSHRPAAQRQLSPRPRAHHSGFRGVPEAVWNFHIGGYQVCHKWLKDRKGRTLTKDDIAHYHKIVIALSEAIRLMAVIDEVIDHHGGWPGAFAGASDATAGDDEPLQHAKASAGGRKSTTTSQPPPYHELPLG